ncbi:hypothetical protein GQR58_025799 [Nymphon striatum]|nr:hypothetical protein GQR58_025799 [Nymphon striatum]
MLGIGHVPFTHPDLTQFRIRRDERDVVPLMYLLRNNWTFTNLDLISLSTDVMAPTGLRRKIEYDQVDTSPNRQFNSSNLSVHTNRENFEDNLVVSRNPRNMMLIRIGTATLMLTLLAFQVSSAEILGLDDLNIPEGIELDLTDGNKIEELIRTQIPLIKSIMANGDPENSIPSLDPYFQD